MKGRGSEIVRVVMDEGRVCSGGGGVVSVNEDESESAKGRSEFGETVRGECALLVTVSAEGSV